MQHKKNIILLIIIFCFVSGALAGDLSVLYKCNRPDISTDTINLLVQIINNSSSSVAMQDLEVRYFYTKEGAGNEDCQVYYAQIGSSNVVVTCKKGYISLTFTPGAGKIPAGWDSGSIELGIVKSDGSTYNQANDFSFDSRKIAFTTNDKIALYKNGVLVFGKEPVQPQNTAEATSTPNPTVVSK